MLESYRVYNDKFLPTLNILDPNTANSWSKMRKIVMNYGHNFKQRHLKLMMCLILYMVLIYVLTWLNNIGVIRLNRTATVELRPFLDIDYFLFTILVIVIIFYIQRINKFAENHVNTLIKIKDLLSELQSNSKHYFGIGTKSKLSFVSLQEKEVQDKAISNPTLKIYIKKLREIVPMEQIPDHLSECAKSWGAAISSVEKEK